MAGWSAFRCWPGGSDEKDVQVGGAGRARGAGGRLGERPRSEGALPEFGSRYSREDYTQPQLFALLVVRQFLRTDYRGVVITVAEWGELRRALGLTKVPHYSTLAHASRRILVDAEAGGLSPAYRLPWSDVPAVTA